MIAVFLADGFEEIEAIAAVDFLRRCDLDVQIIGIGGKVIRGSHQIRVFTDLNDSEAVQSSDFSWEHYDCIVLPGGMPGTNNLEDSEFVQNAIEYAYKNNKLIAAICAAPRVLARFHLLKGKLATCYPGFEDELKENGAIFTDKKVVEDGNFITAKGAGCTVDFAQAIAARFVGEDKAQEVRNALQ